jgi:radical SAM protein with 4Fe4S-binding SPASM domain
MIFLDTNLKNKSTKINETLQMVKINDEILPLPAEIEISESGLCNRKCSFCPRSAPDFVEKKEFIKESLLEKFYKELQDYYYKGTIRFSGFVEPLLDKNIYNIISLTRKYLNRSNIEMVTNGDALNKKRLKMLFDHGLNKILISVYDCKEDADKFESMCVSLKLKVNQYHVRHRYLSEDNDFGITLSNRAGQMANAIFPIKPLNVSLKKACFIPSYTFFLDYQGDVLMCPHDWGKKQILGNLNVSTFQEIWFGKNASNLRLKLINSDRNFTPCNVCDVNGTLMGKKHSDEWKKKPSK